MSESAQAIAAAVIVGVTAAIFAWRLFRGKPGGGCGGGCGCDGKGTNALR